MGHGRVCAKMVILYIDEIILHKLVIVVVVKLFLDRRTTVCSLVFAYGGFHVLSACE